jgi:hypothetical protein
MAGSCIHYEDLQSPQNTGNFLTNWVTISFSRSTGPLDDVSSPWEIHRLKTSKSLFQFQSMHLVLFWHTNSLMSIHLCYDKLNLTLEIIKWATCNHFLLSKLRNREAVIRGQPCRQSKQYLCVNLMISGGEGKGKVDFWLVLKTYCHEVRLLTIWQ